MDTVIAEIEDASGVLLRIVEKQHTDWNKEVLIRVRTSGREGRRSWNTRKRFYSSDDIRFFAEVIDHIPEITACIDDLNIRCEAEGWDMDRIYEATREENARYPHPMLPIGCRRLNETPAFYFSPDGTGYEPLADPVAVIEELVYILKDYAQIS